MPDLTAGCCALTALATRLPAISCSRLRCVNPITSSFVAFSGRQFIFTRQQLVGRLVNASLISAWFLIGFWQLSEYLLQFQRLARRRLSGCVVIWRW